MEKITEIEKTWTKKLAKDLCVAFTWAATADGKSFWQDVHNRLQRISQEGF